MYNTRPGLMIGFHGCDKSQQQFLLTNPFAFQISTKPFEWLGHGMYFWENNYERAFEWARDKQKQGKIKQAAVIGAVIDLIHCCDLLDSRYINMVSAYYRLMELEYKSLGRDLPTNKDLPFDLYYDKIIRSRDCATIEFMHNKIKSRIKRDLTTSNSSRVKIFDSVRGAFNEGGPAFEGSGFYAKSHIQVCIRNPNCIKGFFLKRNEIDFTEQEVRIIAA